MMGHAVLRRNPRHARHPGLRRRSPAAAARPPPGLRRRSPAAAARPPPSAPPGACSSEKESRGRRATAAERRSRARRHGRAGPGPTPPLRPAPPPPPPLPSSRLCEPSYSARSGSGPLRGEPGASPNFRTFTHDGRRATTTRGLASMKTSKKPE